jgi:hypothetical protein
VPVTRLDPPDRQSRYGAALSPSTPNIVDHGFIGFADGDIKTFDAPNAGTGNFQGTRPTTINDSGQVVGWVLDSNSVAQGFIFSPR